MKFFLTLLLSTVFLLPTSTSAQSIDLIWQGNGYTAPFHEGGTPWSTQSVIRLWAIPQGFPNPGTLIYRWSRNGTVLGSLSGVGRNTLEIQDSVLSKTQNFRVEIMSLDDDILAQSTFNIAPQDHELIVYENHPLYGYLFNRAVNGEYRLGRGEVSFSAFPLYMRILDRNQPSLTTIWRSNARESGRGPEITYGRPEGVSGSASVSVRVEDAEILSWPMEKSFLIQFGNE